MLQEQKPTITLGNRTFTINQLLWGVIGLLVIGFIIYGSLSGPAADAPPIGVPR